MRAWMALGVAAALLSACAPPIPDSASGVGFGDYAQYELERAGREAALTGAPSGGFSAPAAVASAPLAQAPMPPGGIPASDLAAAGIGVAPVTSGPIGAAPASAFPTGISPAAPSAVALSGGVVPGSTEQFRPTGVDASPGNAAPSLVGATAPPANGAGISDEQDFDAVASRESIESDAQRRADNAAQYQVVQPQALPDAPQDTGPNIVEYALAAPNTRGQEWYSRFAFSGEGRMGRNCAAYRSPDEAQRDFLASGGPERDRRGVDPDGDGFACGWDPAPFRAAVGRG